MAIGNPISLTSNVATKTINVIATASQTSFTVTGGYRLNELSVFRNGVRLVNGRDFTARDGLTVTLLSAATEGDVLEFQVFDTFRVADAITPFDSAQTIAGDLSIVGVLSATTLGSVNFNLTSGIQTFHDVRVGGALTVAGTLTYEDTTNTTNTGLSTFSGGMNISGVGATVTTLNVTGVSTFAGAVNFNGNLDLQDNDKILLGTGDDLEIYHDGNHSFITDVGQGNLYIRGTEVQIESPGGENMGVFRENGAVDLYHNNSSKLTTKTDGVDITGELQCDSLDVDGTTNFDDDVAFTGASYNASWDKSANSLKFADNAKIQFGSGEDLEIYHDGSNSNIKDTGTGHLQIFADDLFILKADGSETKAQFNSDGNVRLFYDGVEKLATKTDGVDITGELQCDSLDVDGNSSFSGDVDFIGDNYNAVWDKSLNRLKFNDNAQIVFGTGADLKIYHSGSANYIAGDDVRVVNNAVTETMAKFINGGAVELYYNDSKKLETSATGVTVTGTLNATTAITQNGNALATGGKAIAMALIFG